MPRGDGTGPMGMGPMTGRGMGYCAGVAAPGYAGCGFGRGRGRGCRNKYYMTGMPGWERNGVNPYGVPAYAAPAADTAGTVPFTNPGKAEAPVADTKTGANMAYDAGADLSSVIGKKEALQNQAAILKKQLSQVREQLKGLEEEE